MSAEFWAIIAVGIMVSVTVYICVVDVENSLKDIIDLIKP